MLTEEYILFSSKKMLVKKENFPDSFLGETNVK